MSGGFPDSPGWVSPTHITRALLAFLEVCWHCWGWFLPLEQEALEEMSESSGNTISYSWHKTTGRQPQVSWIRNPCLYVQKIWLGCQIQQLWVYESVNREEVSGREYLSLKYPLLSLWLVTYGCQPWS